MGIVMTREDGSTYKLYWAETNLCESGLCQRPEDLGDYYAWEETQPYYAWYLFTKKGRYVGDYCSSRYYGHSVRPVTEG